MTRAAAPSSSPRRRARGAALLAASALLATALLCRARPARADGVAVDVAGCAGLDAGEIRRLLGIELAQLVSQRTGVAPLGVRIGCEGDRVRIAVDDPVTDKRLERTIPAPRAATGRGRERVLAIVVAQLFVTSWSELLLPAPPPEVPRPRTNDAVARAAAARVVGAALRRSSPRVELALLEAARMRQLSAPFLALRAGLQANIALGEHARLLTEASFEYGRATRLVGSVETTTVLLGAGVAWRSGQVGPLGLELGGLVSAGWGRIAGRPTAPGVDPGATSSFVAEAAVSVAPTLHFGALVLALDAQAGVTFPSPTGLVSNEAPVSLAGPWLGIGARVGLAF